MHTLRDLIAQLTALAEQNPELLDAPVITPVITEVPISHELAKPIIEVTRVILDEETDTGLLCDTYFAEEHEQLLHELDVYEQSILAIRIG